MCNLIYEGLPLFLKVKFLRLVRAVFVILIGIILGLFSLFLGLRIIFGNFWFFQRGIYTDEITMELLKNLGSLDNFSKFWLKLFPQILV